MFEVTEQGSTFLLKVKYTVLKHWVDMIMDLPLFV